MDVAVVLSDVWGKGSAGGKGWREKVVALAEEPNHFLAMSMIG